MTLRRADEAMVTEISSNYVTIQQVFVLMDKYVLYFCCTEHVSLSKAAGR